MKPLKMQLMKLWAEQELNQAALRCCPALTERCRRPAWDRSSHCPDGRPWFQSFLPI